MQEYPGRGSCRSVLCNSLAIESRIESGYVGVGGEHTIVVILLIPI